MIQIHVQVGLSEQFGEEKRRQRKFNQMVFIQSLGQNSANEVEVLGEVLFDLIGRRIGVKAVLSCSLKKAPKPKALKRYIHWLINYNYLLGSKAVFKSSVMNSLKSPPPSIPASSKPAAFFS